MVGLCLSSAIQGIGGNEWLRLKHYCVGMWDQMDPYNRMEITEKRASMVIVVWCESYRQLKVQYFRKCSKWREKC